MGIDREYQIKLVPTPQAPPAVFVGGWRSDRLMKELASGHSSMGRYVVVRGALGVGKTTVARALAVALNGRHVSLDEILDREHLEERKSGFLSERSFLRANEFAVRLAKPLLVQGTPVVFDGNFYHRSQIEDLLRSLDFPGLVVTLQAPLDECLRRDRNRDPSYGEESVRAVYAKATEVDYGLRIDARAPVARVVRTIVSRLSKEARAPVRPSASRRRPQQPRT